VGLPDTDLHPPTVAQAGDPFAALRVVHLLARSPLGRPIQVSQLVARLNGEHLDWAFSPRVVAGVVVQLQANWMADFRTVEGIRLEDGPLGPSVEIEDSARARTWLVAQAWRLHEECGDQLREFARGEGRATEG
jgi:hypothetical protein